MLVGKGRYVCSRMMGTTWERNRLGKQRMVDLDLEGYLSLRCLQGLSGRGLAQRNMLIIVNIYCLHILCAMHCLSCLHILSHFILIFLQGKWHYHTHLQLSKLRCIDFTKATQLANGEHRDVQSQHRNGRWNLGTLQGFPWKPSRNNGTAGATLGRQGIKEYAEQEGP